MPRAKPKTGTRNAKAAAAFIAALKKSGHLKAVDAARAAAFETLASMIDEHPANAQLWSRYLDLEKALRGGATSDGPPAASGLAAAMSASLEHAAE